MQLPLLTLTRCKVCKEGVSVFSGMCRRCLRKWYRNDLRKLDKYLDEWYR